MMKMTFEKKAWKWEWIENGKMVTDAANMRYWDSFDWYRDCTDGEKKSYANLHRLTVNARGDQPNEQCYFLI